MSLKITRRQFAQAAIATTATAALGVVANKTSAQIIPSPVTVILGVRAGSISGSNNSGTPEIDSTDLTDEITGTTAASTTQSIVVESLNVLSLLLTPILTSIPVLEAGELLSGFAPLKDGRYVVAATNFAKKADQPTRLIILQVGASPKIVNVSGLKKQEAVLDLLTRKDGSLGALVGKKNGTPPVSIVTIDPGTGNITDENKLPGNLRVSTVAQCPDGNLYGIGLERKGETSLVQIDNKGQTIPLRFEGQPWNSGFSRLVCSASNQLYALGARRYESPKYLHSIDKKTGEISRIKQFDVAKIGILLG